jgi:hypothetical protein
MRKKCIHNKQKRYCKECKGSGICEHNKHKSKCKECKGSGICEHNKQKSNCKECKGSGICEHNKQKSSCKECKGSGICEHNKRKSSCKECKGSGICEHNKEKRFCKECKGSGICEHNKHKSLCKECGGSALCKSSHCEKRGIPKYNKYCLTCVIHVLPEIKVSRNYKTKENTVVTRVKSNFPDLTWSIDKKIPDGCSARRPDLLLDIGSHIIIIEIDENKHNSYDCSCENKRLLLLSKDLNYRPIVFIRFNPDAYKTIDGIRVTSCWRLNKIGILTIPKTKLEEWEIRITTLINQIQYWIDNPTEKTIEIIELFY